MRLGLTLRAQGRQRAGHGQERVNRQLLGALVTLEIRSCQEAFHRHTGGLEALAHHLAALAKRRAASDAGGTPRKCGSSASLKAMAASYTPGPVSVCRPSMGTPKAAIGAVISARVRRSCA